MGNPVVQSLSQNYHIPILGTFLVSPAHIEKAG